MNYCFRNILIKIVLVTSVLLSSDIMANDIASLKEKQRDMRMIMEHPIRHVFKFPNEVQFKDVQFSYRSMLAELGVKGKESDLYEFAEMCGFYSATNAVGISGKYEKFYASLYIDNKDRNLDGEIWLVAEGEFKYSRALDDTYLLSTDEDKFNLKWKPMCEGLEKSHMGLFSTYDYDLNASINVQSITEFSEELDSPELKKHFGACIDRKFNFETCFTSALCSSDKDYGDSCVEPLNLCAGDMNSELCWRKIEDHIK